MADPATEARYLTARRVASDPATGLPERRAANAEARDLRRAVGPYRTAHLDDQVHDELTTPHRSEEPA